MQRKLVFALAVIFLIQFLPLFNQGVFTLPGTDLTFNLRSVSFLKPYFSESYQNLSSASATMSNSRFSFSALLNGTAAPGTATINIQSSSAPDLDTVHLFMKDVVYFAGTNTTTPYTISNVANSTTFSISPAIASGSTPGNNSVIYSKETSTITLRFTTASTIPVNGKLVVYIPSSTAGNYNDMIPDSVGFDRNSLTNADIQNIMIGNTFPTASTTITTGTAPDGSTNSIVITLTGNALAIPSGTQTVIIGTVAKPLLNPAPSSGSKVRGLADIYPITIRTTDASSNELDRSIVKVAPVEGVFVSASINEVLTFRVCGVAADLTANAACYTVAPANICGAVTLDVPTSATAIPFGSINASTFYNASQYLKVSTNSTTGYNVTVEENDQMGKNGQACDDGSFPTTCIPDATCGGSGTCTNNSAEDWLGSGTAGLGYSMMNQSGSTDAVFTYNVPAGRTFSAKRFSDTTKTTGAETAAQVMSRATVVSNAGAFVCIRLTVSATQPAGYYYNKLKYTATPSF